ncbi:MAG: hypothetical protein GX777_03095 [Fastidiosipila sp.]|nr:hypothetical protein [Fastidiosipila sp.]
MIDIKLLLARILTRLIPTEMFVTERIASDEITTSSSGYNSVTVDVAKQGYTPMAIVGLAVNGTGYGQMVIRGFSISGNEATILVRNVSTSTTTQVYYNVTVLYVRN